MQLEELQKRVMELPDSDRAGLAADLPIPLPAQLVNNDDGIAEPRRHSKDLDEALSAGGSWPEIKQAL